MIIVAHRRRLIKILHFTINNYMRYNQLTEVKKGYTGYELNRTSRQKLLKQFPPKFPDVYADHVTYKYNVGEEAVPSAPKSAKIVGYAEKNGLEAFVVEINGKKTRPDGRIFHITWSLDKSKGRKPVQSDNLIVSGWQPINHVPIKLTPKFFKFKF